VGKGPLYHALRKFYPDLAGRLHQIVLYNSRDPRPGEQEGVDYYFRPRAEIEELAKKPGFTSAIVRGDLQAIEIASIQAILDQDKDAFFEGNPFIPAKLGELKELRKFQRLGFFYLLFPRRRLSSSKTRNSAPTSKNYCRISCAGNFYAAPNARKSIWR
jgi:guanylate kinase